VRFLVLAIPTELASGRYAVPAWAILALGAAVVVAAAALIALRLRRRAPRAEDGGAPPKEKP
jgi:hypothetical protein